MSRPLVIRLLVLAAVAGAAAFLYWQYGHLLSLDRLAEREQRLRQLRLEHPLLTYVGALLIYVAVTGLSLPGATVLTLAYGWYFGFWSGLLLVSFASTAGATLAFLLSRYLLRDWVRRRFDERLSKFDESLHREGPFFLLTLRLIPAAPFFVINVVMGLMPMSALTFWWVSQLGMLPGTIVYVFAGHSVPDLQTLADQGASGLLTPGVIGALLVLAAFPLAVRWVMRSVRSEPVEW